MLELSILLKHETYFDKLQFFSREIIQLYHGNTDIFVTSRSTSDFKADLCFLTKLLNFSKLSENHDNFGNNKNEEIVGKIKVETPKNLWIEELICLGSKADSFRYLDGEMIEKKVQKDFLVRDQKKLS